ncbi:B3 domain-containing protein Os11g0197600-like [Papaver somniferum]|uniref:B3 domain-containing protein Os11g0197600-like n=1 Tax=Papaver somniferum TaxID=3469 RepID=UPI000E6FA758|nr:B3 domain-containing protein Os11g0197600-like [Papaver somniferum]
MSEGEVENQIHDCETGAEGMDRAESISLIKGKGKCKVEEDSEESDDELEETPEDATSSSKYPYFLATLKSYNTGRSFLPIPRIFSRSNIPDDIETIVLKDEEGKEWPIKLTRREDSCGVYCGFGWYDFQLEKGLKKGDICLFEQENEDQLEFTVSIIRIIK